MLRSLVIVCLGCWGLIALATSAVAQAPFRVEATYGDTREVTCMVVQGNALWVGTLGAGMLRIDEKSRRTFGSTTGLPGQRVRDCVLNHGMLWVATESGLAHYDAGSERFVVTARGRFLKLASQGTTLIAASGDTALWRVDVLGDRVSRLISPIEMVASAMTLSADASHWAAGGLDGRVVVVDGHGFVTVLPATTKPHPEPIEALYFADDTLHVQTSDHNFVYAPGSTTPHVESSAATTERIAGRRVVGETLWQGQRIARTDAGVYSFDEKQTPHALALMSALPCGDRISALAVHAGALYVGSFDRGVCRLEANGDVSVLQGPSVLPSDMINDLVSDGTRLYIATARGLAVIEADGKVQQFTSAQCSGHLSKPCPWFASLNGVAFDASTQRVWAGDLGSVHRLDDLAHWKHFSGDAYFGSHALTHLAAHGGELAIGSSDHGVSIGTLAPNTPTTKTATLTQLDDQSGLADNWVMDVSYDAQGTLWIATCTHGVSMRHPDGKLSTFTTADGLADDYVLSVNTIGQRMWIGTLRGVSIVDSADRTRVQTLDVSAGLSGNEVHDAVLWNGKVWLATDGGLSVLSDAGATDHDADHDARVAASYHR